MDKSKKLYCGGFSANIEFADSCYGILRAEVEDVRDDIVFYGNSREELLSKFNEAINDYSIKCKKSGRVTRVSWPKESFTLRCNNCNAESIIYLETGKELGERYIYTENNIEISPHVKCNNCGMTIDQNACRDYEYDEEDD